MKNEILKQLIERLKHSHLNFSKINKIDLSQEAEVVLRTILKRNKDIHLSPLEEKEIIDEAVAYFFGLGPIESLLKDPTISEILINGPRQVYVERSGNLELTDISFWDEKHLSYFIEKMLAPSGRRLSESEPYIDARLEDGSRVNVVIKPVSSSGPIVTIRKFMYQIFDLDELIKLGTLNKLVADFLKACVISRLNMLITGGASTGKTTLLNALASFIPERERIIVIEDVRELRISKNHVIYLETRPPNIEGKGEIKIRDLFKNALHMRPDRIIIGEVKSDEVWDMIQAMNTGHEGSMTTLHANSPLDALDRLETLFIMGSPPNFSSEVAKRQIIRGIDLVIHLGRFIDGSRKIIQISEILKAKEYVLQDIFVFDEKEDNGKLKFTGKVPTFYPRLKKEANFFYEGFEQEE
jgi:pilus assembly protein CpaF